MASDLAALARDLDARCRLRGSFVLRMLRELGAIVTAVACVIDRSPPGENPLAAEGIAVRPVLTKRQLDSVAG